MESRNKQARVGVCEHRNSGSILKLLPIQLRQFISHLKRGPIRCVLREKFEHRLKNIYFYEIANGEEKQVRFRKKEILLIKSCK